MANLPPSLGVAFGLTTGLAVGLFYWAARRAGRSLLVVLAWLLLQGAVARSGFYAHTAAGQPRLLLLLGPPLLLIAGLLTTAAGRRYVDGLRLETLTLLHVVRVPVELVLFGLFLHHAVPQLMTFEGRNLDVLAGLTAPVVFYLAFVAKRLGPRGLLVWNLVGLGSLLNIVAIAVLSAPSPFQRFAFEQPNVAILHFPFAFLPGCVVPLVLLAHLAAIKQLVAPAPPLAAGLKSRESEA